MWNDVNWPLNLLEVSKEKEFNHSFGSVLEFLSLGLCMWLIRRSDSLSLSDCVNSRHFSPEFSHQSPHVDPARWYTGLLPSSAPKYLSVCPWGTFGDPMKQLMLALAPVWQKISGRVTLPKTLSVTGYAAKSENGPRASTRPGPVEKSVIPIECMWSSDPVQLFQRQQWKSVKLCETIWNDVKLCETMWNNVKRCELTPQSTWSFEGKRI